MSSSVIRYNIQETLRGSHQLRVNVQPLARRVGVRLDYARHGVKERQRCLEWMRWAWSHQVQGVIYTLYDADAARYLQMYAS